MAYETVVKTDVGQARPANEDAVAAVDGDGWALIVVADGMGGHRAGDVASRAAIDEFVTTVESAIDRGAIDQGDGSAISDCLRRAVVEANDDLRAMIEEDRSLEGMGTTLVATVLVDGEAHLVNVGDSRGYRVTPQSIEQVTVDHSLVQSLVDEGAISPAEARDHPQSNVVSQSLGTDSTVEPDTFRVDLDGWILLCSDGLTAEVPDDQIHAIIAGSDSPRAAAEELIARANQNGGSDNISVAIGRSELTK